MRTCEKVDLEEWEQREKAKWPWIIAIILPIIGFMPIFLNIFGIISEDFMRQWLWFLFMIAVMFVCMILLYAFIQFVRFG